MEYRLYSITRKLALLSNKAFIQKSAQFKHGEYCLDIVKAEVEVFQLLLGEWSM